MKYFLISLLIVLTLGDIFTTKIGLNYGLEEAIKLSSFLQENNLWVVLKIALIIPIIIGLLLVDKTGLAWLKTTLIIVTSFDCLILASAVINNVVQLWL